MQAEINDMAGYVQGQAYAPADFNDVDGQEINAQPIQNTLSHGISYHAYSMNDKVQQSRAWRKKLRDLIQYHREHIIEFLVKPMSADHTISSATVMIIEAYMTCGFPVAGQVSCRQESEHLFAEPR
jgi:hypothetical protein